MDVVSGFADIISFLSKMCGEGLIFVEHCCSVNIMC